MTAQQPSPGISLSSRIDASLAAMSDEDDILFDSPFAPRDPRDPRDESDLPAPPPARADRRDPSVVTSAKRTPRTPHPGAPASASAGSSAAANRDRDRDRDVFAEMARGRSAAEFAAETAPAMASYPDDADVTSQQPLAELEELAARSAPSRANMRRARDTHEIEADDIEAAIEVAPPARRNPGSVVQRLPRGPGKPK